MPLLATERFPARSDTLTESVPFPVMSACRAVVVLVPTSKVTVVSVAEMVESVAIRTLSK